MIMDQILDQTLVAIVEEPIMRDGPTISILDVGLGGWVLVEKVSEPLDGFLKAQDAKLINDTPLLAKLQEYPNPRKEEKGLIWHQWLIRDT